MNSKEASVMLMLYSAQTQTRALKIIQSLGTQFHIKCHFCTANTKM